MENPQVVSTVNNKLFCSLVLLPFCFLISDAMFMLQHPMACPEGFFLCVCVCVLCLCVAQGVGEELG